MIRLPCRLKVKCQIEIIIIYHLTGWDIYKCRYGKSSGIIRICCKICLTDIVDSKNRIHISLVQCKCPVTSRHIRSLWICGSKTDHILQSQKSSYNHTTVRPRAYRRPQKAITSRLYRKLSFSLTKRCLKLILLAVEISFTVYFFIYPFCRCIFSHNLFPFLRCLILFFLLLSDTHFFRSLLLSCWKKSTDPSADFVFLLN